MITGIVDFSLSTCFIDASILGPFYIAIALQYMGSAFVNRVETYRTILQIPFSVSLSNACIFIYTMFTHTAFRTSDADKQAAVNPFLGVNNERAIIHPPVPGGYQQWFNPDHLSLAFNTEE